MAARTGKGPKALVPTTDQEELVDRVSPELRRAQDALDRLEKERLLDFLVQGALGKESLRRVAVGREKLDAEGRQLEAELLATWVVSRAFQNPELEAALVDALDDRLALDREPATFDEWKELASERPLEALWAMAQTESKAIRKEFRALAASCKAAFRQSPDCPPPSWQYVEEHVAVTADVVVRLERAEKELGERTRRLESELGRNAELRDELKRLRRENSELKAERAGAARRVAAAAESQRLEAGALERARVEELERRLRKAEKEREHLSRLLERQEEAKSEPRSRAAAEPETRGRAEPDEGELDGAALDVGAGESDALLPTRVRVVRQMLRKLISKRKIGAAHTHEDNVYRGVPDHEKGLAKEAMELLYREGILMPKSTIADPHVSIRPERLPEVRQLLAGEVSNERLALWLESGS